MNLQLAMFGMGCLLGALISFLLIATNIENKYFDANKAETQLSIGKERCINSGGLNRFNLYGKFVCVDGTSISIKL